jgi:hypothetical protein
MNIESLLEGAYDLHVHAAPDVVPRVTDFVRLSKTAVEKKMGGLLIKDHTTSTTGRVFVLNQVFGGSCRFFSSLALNSPVGFVNASAVESALRSGTDLIYFPTYAAKNHINKWGPGKPPTAFPVLDKDREGYALFNTSGHLKKEVTGVLEMMARYDVVLGTGHISPLESLSLIKEAIKTGIEGIIVTHASGPVIQMDPDQQKEAVQMGAVIEHCFFAVTESCPRKIQLEDIRDQIRYVGVSSCILSSDFGQVQNPHPVEGFAYYLNKMRNLGFSDEELRIMIHDNPKVLMSKKRKK